MIYFPPRRILIGLSAALIAVALLAGSQLPARAQSSGEGAQALEIGPPIINLVADPGETVSATISIRDVSDGPLLVTAQINDFVAGDELGTPKLLLEDGEESPYSMKTWFSPIGSLELQPREIVEQRIQIHVPASAAPGGYYSVIRFTGTAPDIDTSGVSLSASIGSLVFLRVNGDVERNISIEEFTTSSRGNATGLFQSAPIDFVVRLKNEGTIHEQPTGKVTVSDMFGNKVGIVNVNLPPRNILPDSVRKFEQSFDSSVIGNRFLFGRYTADLEVAYGDGQTVTSRISFWVIPYTLIGVIVLGLIAAFVLLRVLIKRYNRHIIKQAQKRRP
jgi:hypothetical protein